MRTLNAAIMIILALLIGAPMAAAADAEAPAPPISIEIEAGLNGYVDPLSPFPVSIELTSDTLFVGRLEVRTRTGTIPVTVEVPAGGVKRYDIVAGAPADRRRLTVAVLDDDGEDVLTETVNLRIPDGELLVGTIGTDELTGLDTTLRSATSTPLGRSVATATVGESDIGPALAPVSYLIAGNNAFSGIDDAAADTLRRWIEGGGRLYGTASALEAVADVGTDLVTMTSGVAVARRGSGEIGIVDDLSMGSDEWSAILRDRPGAMAIVDQTAVQSQANLMAAASSGQSAAVPALPWLLAGIAVFVLLVGPVNFLVLRALGKPELAWLTVPALSIVFLAGFWFVGRAQLADHSVSHATVVIDDGSAPVAQAGLLLQVASAGEHRLTVPTDWQALPVSAPGGISSGIAEDNAVTFQLDNLGLGATEMTWTATEDLLDSSATASGEGLTITIRNTSQWPMWAWGVVVNGSGHNGSGVLAAGAEGTIEVPAGASRTAFEPVISEAVNRRPYTADSPRDVYGLISPMAAHVESSVPALRRSGVYAFGVTSDRQLPITVDSTSSASQGTTLVVQRIDVDAADLAALGGVRPEILDVTGASSVERYGDEVYAYAAESVTFLYQVPAGAPTSAQLRNRFTGFDNVDWWDWEQSRVVPLAQGGSLDLQAMTSAGGDLVVRASVDDAESFFDQAISLQRHSLTWGDA